MKNKVYLLVGQQGSGKSHYGRRLMEKYPDLQAVSRDEILIRLFGSIYTNPYTGACHIAIEIMMRLLRRKLSKKGLSIILDHWTGDGRERKRLIRQLRQYGADQIIALYFTTPLEIVENWFWKKPGIAKVGGPKSERDENTILILEDAPRHDHELFHRLALSIDSDGFDQVLRVDPTKDLITLAL